MPTLRNQGPFNSRIAKFAKRRCCVCNKYGADEPFGEPVLNVRYRAEQLKLTLRGPRTNDAHPKCLKQLKELIKAKS